MRKDQKASLGAEAVASLANTPRSLKGIRC